jgi:hypothetical protein
MTEKTSLQEKIDDYLNSIKELNLVALKLINDDEIVGVLDKETANTITLIHPIQLMPTYHLIERWLPQDLDEEEEEDIELMGSAGFGESEPPGVQRQMFELFSKTQEGPTIFGNDDFPFQDKQRRILYNEANSKKMIAFYHMMEWFQHSDDITREINKMTIITKAEASNELKHEYIVFLKEKVNQQEFFLNRQIEEPSIPHEPLEELDSLSKRVH